MFSPQLLVLVAVAAIVARLYISRSRSASASGGLVLPPGPKPLPILGNIFDLTPNELWLRATSWAKSYGDITYIHVFGIPLVFLNTPQAVFDLLDRRGSIYSDKPQLTMVCDLCGCGDMVAFTGYGAQSKRQRKLLNLAFAGTRIPTYFPLITRETNLFIQRLLAPKAPDMTQEQSQLQYMSLIRRYAGQLTLSVVYGYQTRGNSDPFLDLAEECVDLLSNKIASGGGIWPVDIFPSLRYLPDWAPGSGFLRKAKAWKAKMTEFVDKPYQSVKNSMKSNTHRPSFCSTLLENSEANPNAKEKSVSDASQFEFDLKWTANSMYSASGDTTMTTISYFLLQMALHPEILAKARSELSILGTRLPTFTDRPNLPYCEALFKETLRHNAAVPLSLPHRLMEDDIYINPTTGKETLMKKGSLVFANVWAITRDSKLWPAPPSHPNVTPEDFCPERHLLSAHDSAVLAGKAGTLEERDSLKRLLKSRDPRTYVFGFGRRQCPGQNLVDSSAWLVMVCLIAAVDWSFADGQAPEIKYQNGVFRTPSSFKLDVRPRSEEWMSIVEASGMEEEDD
ncbi:cytochrome p450 [Moniliophthora roreri]|uniref:Cytochrome P450 n=1 Tax=Moniliophthora roreri TaxID=221103 RepID=A0A0W0FCT7_MONRR|nr:cytochrome p450 [Moniliophthora roreri]